MKFFIRYISFFFLCYSVPGVAQEREPVKFKYPLYAKSQYAGSIGFVSAGIGKSFFKDKVEADLLLGYLPKSIGGIELFTAAFKGTYYPFDAIRWKNKLAFTPFGTGFQISYTFGDKYFVAPSRDQYPKGYYPFSTAMHLYYLVGGKADVYLGKGLPTIAPYYEFNTSVESIAALAQNPQFIGLDDIFNLALGIKVRF